MSSSIQITILHTNDMHSTLEAMSRLSTFERKYHRELTRRGRRVFFFDAGDATDRCERFCSITKGKVFPHLMAAMGDHGYDMQTLGNAISFTYGPQAAAEMARAACFPILAANYFKDGQPLLDGFQPFVIFPLEEGLRLGVIGLTVDPPFMKDFFGLDQTEFRQSAREWLPILQASGRGPLVVVSHLGLVKDRQLAEACPEIDVIIGGHSHDALPDGEMVNGVLITQAGDYARLLGEVNIEIDPLSGKVLHKSARLIEVPPDTPPDAGFEKALQEAKDEAIRFMSRSVGALQEAFSQDFFAECDVANLAADALIERMQAEAAILTGGLFCKPLPAGNVTLGELDEACFTTANPQLSLLRGEQIKAALETALEPELMHIYFKAFRGPPIGHPVVGGMVVEYDPLAPSGERIKSIQIQGRLLQPQRLYLVAHTDAEVIEEEIPVGYIRLEPGQNLVTETPTILREAIEDYLQAHSPLARPIGGRWRKASLFEG